MPAGRVHDRITWWTMPWLGAGCAWLTDSPRLTLVMSSAYLFSGLMFGPDLDIYSVQYKRWGPLRWLWLPYQKLLRHRSWLSHSVLIGTLLRLIYLFIILTAIALPTCLLWQIMTAEYWNWEQVFQRLGTERWQKYQLEILTLLVGLELGAISHLLSDWSVTAYKRLKSVTGQKKAQGKRHHRRK